MDSNDQKRVVIVDGYSTGRALVRALLERNCECLHLQSAEVPPAPAVQSFDPTPYDGDLGFAGDADAAIELLSSLAPQAVVPGSEWGVTYAERVAHGMGLPTNRIETIAARRDKFEMIEAVRRHGLHAARQALVATLDEAHDWAEEHACWPIVLKPLASAAADGVSICHSHADIDAAFASAFGRRNFMGGINDRLLMQSYLPGPQFIVNTVSWNGRHCVTDIWAMSLNASGSGVVPEGIHLLDPETAQARQLIDYTLGVLAALGIENGAAHTELKWTPEGPALIETGARLMGAAMDEPSYLAAGMRTQASVFACALAGTQEERDTLFATGRYRLVLHMTKLLFLFRADGTIRGTEGLARLASLASFHMHYRPLAKGSRIRKTADWLACGGVIYLVHRDPLRIEADIATIRQWERDGLLYDIAPIPDARHPDAAAVAAAA